MIARLRGVPIDSDGGRSILALVGSDDPIVYCPNMD